MTAVVAALLLGGCVGPSRHSRANATSSRAPSITTRSVAPEPSRAAAASAPAHRSAVAADPPGAAGRVVSRNIVSRTGFHPRPAYVYLPPAYLAHPARRLPVLELLHGTPGEPSNWVLRGQLRSTADAFAAAHNGRTPIIVMPDINGSWSADSECIRTAAGADVETYLSRDVVAYVRRAFASAVGRTRWWIAGASEGGLCAAMLALRHPSTYSAFGDLSGLARPTVEHVSAAASVQQLYGNDRTAELEHELVWLLQHRRYPTMRGYFECGVLDTEVCNDQATVVATAAAAGIPTRASVWPGRHGWSVWRGSLRRLLPWLWERAPS